MTSSSNFMIGVAPFDIDRNGKNTYSQLADATSILAILDSALVLLCTVTKPSLITKTGELTLYSIVTTKFNVDKKTISCFINETDYGIAFDIILTAKEICFCIMMLY